MFASEQALLSTTSCINFLGPEATLDSHWCSKLHTEALSQVALNDHNDNLKILIALFGMRHVGVRPSLFFKNQKTNHSILARNERFDKKIKEPLLLQHVRPEAHVDPQETL